MNSIFSAAPIIHFPRPGRWKETLLARRRSPDIDQPTLDAILAHYHLELASGPRNMPNARRNQNLVLHTTAGKKVVKRYRTDWLSATILFEHSILNRLMGIGFAAPRLVKAPDGETCFNSQGHNYCLFDFLDGSNYSSSFLLRPQRVRMMYTAGGTLARLHRHLQGFLPAGRHHLGFRDYNGDRWRDITWYTTALEEFGNRLQGLDDPIQRSHASWLINHSEKILREIDSVGKRLAAANLPRLIIHGDYGLHNLLYQSIDFAVPVDFELARLEWRLCDLVSVVSKFRYTNGSYDLESITHFLRAYQREFPIPENEWEWMPLVWKFYKLTKAVQYWSSFFETNGPTRKLVSAREEILQSSWAEEHFGQLSAYRGGIH